MGHDSVAAPPPEWAALDALVRDVVETRRQVAILQAREARLLSDAVDLVTGRILERRRSGKRISDADLPLREVSAELGAAMRLSDRTVQRRLGDASSLVSRFPATMHAWDSGSIDAGHADAILDAGAVIADDGVRAQYENRMLEIAAHETPASLRSVARAVAARLDPASVSEAQRRAQADRGVRVIDLGDGMGRLLADLPAVLAYAVHDRLTLMAQHAKSHPAEAVPADARSIDQLRADILADLLLAGAPVAHGDGLAAITGHVQVTIPVLTLAGVGDQPALLIGHGPIDPDMARTLAAGSPGWDRVMTHPFTGAVLAVDRYRVPADLARFLHARDEHCRAMGCRRHSLRSDIDHTIEAARGGPTADHNLAHLCRRHHVLRHGTAWSVKQLGGGVLEWTSPTRRRYEEHPPATVRFVPTDGAELTHAGRGQGADGDPPPF